MQHTNLFDRMEELNKELHRMLDEEPTCLEPKVDPRFIKLLEEAVAVQKELDVLMRGTFHNRPDELAKWEKKMQLCKECDAEGFLEELRSQED
jgi:hypothetical protein